MDNKTLKQIISQIKKYVSCLFAYLFVRHRFFLFLNHLSTFAPCEFSF